MATEYLNANNKGTFGFDKVSLIDDKYIELIVRGKSVLRKYTINEKGYGKFYYAGNRYKVSNIRKEFATIVREIDQGNRKIEVDFSKKTNNVGVGKPKHSQHDTIKTCIQADIPVYLVGEAGTGKNFTLQQIAEEMEMEFYFTNSIQQEFKITGFIDAGGHYHETEFYRAFKNGGMFFLDEMDASIPEVLVLLNAAIANKYFEFPNGKINAHPDFRIVAAGNTLGSGANELYTGRLVLDSSSLDRYAVIEFGYERSIELALAKGNEDLVNFIRSLRDFCKTNGIRGTFSYRMIMAVQKLEEAGMELSQIVKIAVIKGLDADTIRTIEVKNSGKYFYALQKAKTA